MGGAGASEDGSAMKSCPSLAPEPSSQLGLLVHSQVVHSAWSAVSALCPVFGTVSGGREK